MISPTSVDEEYPLAAKKDKCILNCMVLLLNIRVDEYSIAIVEESSRNALIWKLRAECIAVVKEGIKTLL